MPDMNTFTVPIAQKYQQNKTRTTDTYYKHINTSREYRNQLRSNKSSKV